MTYWFPGGVPFIDGQSNTLQNGSGYLVDINHNFKPPSQAQAGGQDPDESYSNGALLLYQAEHDSPHVMTGQIYSYTTNQSEDSVQIILQQAYPTNITDLGQPYNVSGFNISNTGDFSVRYASGGGTIPLTNTALTNSSKTTAVSAGAVTPEWQAKNVGSFFDIFPPSGAAWINKRNYTPQIDTYGVNNDGSKAPNQFTERENFAPLTYDFVKRGDIMELTSYQSNSVNITTRQYNFNTPLVNTAVSNSASITVTVHIAHNFTADGILMNQIIRDAKKGYVEKTPLELRGTSLNQPVVQEGLPAVALSTGTIPSGLAIIPNPTAAARQIVGKLPSNAQMDTWYANRTTFDSSLTQASAAARITNQVENYTKIYQTETTYLETTGVNTNTSSNVASYVKPANNINAAAEITTAVVNNELSKIVNDPNPANTEVIKTAFEADLRANNNLTEAQLEAAVVQSKSVFDGTVGAFVKLAEQGRSDITNTSAQAVSSNVINIDVKAAANAVNSAQSNTTGTVVSNYTVSNGNYTTTI